jgi:putative molybdopterin biosynthesis protein
MALLLAVRENGSISGAARHLAQSYRHVWGELKRWEDRLGQGLVVWDKGQPARLTGFADKLLWAELKAQARLAPQIESLQVALERVFAQALDESSHVLHLHASHDDALSLLRHHADSFGVHLDIHFTGSVDALRALNQGRCTLAGFHAMERPPVGSVAQRIYKPLLRPGLHKLIGFARRSQGLMVARGNPLGIHSLADVARLRARYVNRPVGTGTRVLLEELLAESGLPAEALPGYDRVEPSHAAVASAVASGSADAGLGLESSARAFGLGAQLDFIPLTRETYHLACLKSALETPATQALLQLLASPAWQQELRRLAGYEPDASGQVQRLNTVLPWWKFRAPSKGA